MSKDLVIKWSINGNNINYFVNDKYIGSNDMGFDDILKLIKRNQDARVILNISAVPSFGGEDLTDLLPFKNRLNDFLNALGRRNPVYDFFK